MLWIRKRVFIETCSSLRKAQRPCFKHVHPCAKRSGHVSKTLLHGIDDLMAFPSEEEKGKCYCLSILSLARAWLLKFIKNVTLFMSDPYFLICFSELLSFSRLVTVVYNIPYLLLRPKRESVVIGTLRTHWQGWMTHKQVGKWNLN